MGQRHVVHASTREAIVARRASGQTFLAIATELGDTALTATLSAIVNERHTTSKAMEKRVRKGLGLAEKTYPSQAERNRLLALLNGAGITLTEALRIAARERGLVE